MAYTAQIGNDFWLEFDDIFLHKRPRNVTQAILGLYPGGNIDLLLSAWTVAHDSGNPAAFTTLASSKAAPLNTLATLQQDVFVKHFSNNLDDELSAFVDFGQGTLFDDRRNPGLKIHMMDVNSTGAQIGYHRWYTFALACSLAGVATNVWDPRMRHLAIALDLHIAASPQQDLPGQTVGNSPLPTAQVDAIKTRWMAASADEINTLYLSTNPLGTSLAV